MKVILSSSSGVDVTHDGERSVGVRYVLLGAVLSVVSAAVCFPGTVARADDLQVLSEPTGHLLYEHLRSIVGEQYDARRRDLEQALESSDAVLQRRERLRQDFRTLLGDLPERTPLNARTVGMIECDGYRIEKVLFESRPRHRVTANLYLPERIEGPLPGVLVPCGHSTNGKASEAYQSVCILLALNGMAALIYDPIGQGERHQLREAPRHGTTEHTLVGAGALLVGWNTGNYRVWDGLRAMDYLASRPEVDPERLGCTGNSGGGTMTTWLMAVDDRIRVAAPSCFITTVERLFATIGPQDCEQHFPGQGALGIEHTDFITMRAPRPTMILAAEQDFFDFAGTRTAYAEAQAVYRVLGRADRVGMFSYDDKHGFSQPRRQAAVHWMLRWLLDDDRPVAEPTLTLQPGETLQVTRAGQVIDEFDDEQTVVDFALRRAAELAAARRERWSTLTVEQQRDTVADALGIDRNRLADEVEVTPGETLRRDGYRIEKLVIRRSGAIPVPALKFVPDGDRGPRPGVLYLDGRGKQVDAAPGGRIEELVADGKVVLSIDLQGVGETADRGADGKYYNDEFRVAMVALHIGRPLLTVRVEDALVALGALCADERVDSRQVHAIGIERGGPIALHAAAFDPRIASLERIDSIDSWVEDVVARPLEPNRLGEVVFGVLNRYDLPDLLELVGDASSADH